MIGDGSHGGPGGAQPAAGLSSLLAELAQAPERDHREAAERPLRAGDVVGRFELGPELGRGGFGVVFEARDRELNRRVAFKVIRPGRREQAPARAELLRREAEAVAQLAHPNIVTIFDAGRAEAGPYLVLELLEGEPLDRRMARGPLPPAEVLRIAIGIARALVHAHGRGVLHRDLKPGNVFLAADGEPKVLDFGLAHVFGLTSPRGAGTPRYMAPEQRRGEEEDARADVWAVGVILWELLAGRLLSDVELVEGGGAPPRIPAAGLSAGLAELVTRCLALRREDRPPSAAALLSELEGIERRAGRRLALRRALALVAAVTVAAGGAGWYLGLRRAAVPAAAVAVADARNETGNPRLDAVAALLLSSLGQSQRVSVIPRERLEAFREDGASPSPRLEGEGARSAARRAGARLLLELTVAPARPGFSFRLHGVDAGTGAERLAFSEQAPDEPSVPAAIDRLSARLRRELGEGPAELREHELQIGRAMTADLEAYRHYFLGEQCAARPVYGQDCSPHFRRAAELDPAFAAAHYQLALWAFWYGAPLEEQLATIERAVAKAGAAPERERLLISAWDAFLHGKDEEALGHYRVVTERWPQDRSGWYQTGEILRRRDELAEAAPWFEKAVEVDPEYGWALSHLVTCLGASGRRADLERWAERWEGSARPSELHALVFARGWLGDLAGAEAAAKRAIALGGGVSAQEDLFLVLTAAGRYAQVEGAMKGLAAPGSEIRPMAYYALAAMAGYQGRRGAGLAALDALERALPAVARQALYWNARIEYRLGDRDAGAVAAEIASLRLLEPRAAAEHAAEVAWLGDLPLGSALAAGLREGSVLRRTWEGVDRFRRGEREAGLAALQAVAAERPLVNWRVAPTYLLAELAAEAGRCDVAREALRRFEASFQPLAMWRSWALPRSRQLAERCGAPRAAGARSAP